MDDAMLGQAMDFAEERQGTVESAMIRALIEELERYKYALKSRDMPQVEYRETSGYWLEEPTGHITDLD